MDAPYEPSLVWVCLACGQVAPYHANPHDLMDSANAMDLNLTSSSPMPLPSVLTAVSDDEVFRSPGVMARATATAATAAAVSADDARRHHSVEQHSLSGRSNGSVFTTTASQGNGDDDYTFASPASPCGSASLTCRHRSVSREEKRSCLNHESDSYLSMAAVSHHQRHQREQQQQQQQQRSEMGNNTDGNYDGGTDKLEEPNARSLDGGASFGHHSSSGASPAEQQPYTGTYHGSFSSPLKERCSDTHFSQRQHQHSHHNHPSSSSGRAATAPDPMQSIAAMLMEEHLVGSREMRFCENCHEVRCAEIRQASEVLPHSAYASNNTAQAYAHYLDPLQPRTAYHDPSSYRCQDHKANSGAQSNSNVNQQFLSSRVPQQDDQDLPLSSPNAHPNSSSSHSSFASATCARPPRQREVVSGHYVVALSVARMLLKVKSVAASVLHNFHPLSPSLPAARPYRQGRSEGTKDGEADDQGGCHRSSNERLTDSELCGRSGIPLSQQQQQQQQRQHHQPLSPTSTAGTTPSSYESAAKPYEAEQLVSSLNSSIAEAAAAAGCGTESNDISYDSFTATSPANRDAHQRQQTKTRHSPDQSHTDSAGRAMHPTQLTRDGDGLPSSLDSPSSVVTAQASLLLLPRDAEAGLPRLAPASATSTTTAPHTAEAAALLRESKEKWNATSVPEALWRLVLPSFGPPFLGSAQAGGAAGSSSSCGGSVQSTPQRGACGVGERADKPYRGFRGGVEEAVGQLDAMQLEVAKLRLEQILAAVSAEQSRRENSDV